MLRVQLVDHMGAHLLVPVDVCVRVIVFGVAGGLICYFRVRAHVFVSCWFVSVFVPHPSGWGC